MGEASSYYFALITLTRTHAHTHTFGFCLVDSNKRRGCGNLLVLHSHRAMLIAI